MFFRCLLVINFETEFLSLVGLCRWPLSDFIDWLYVEITTFHIPQDSRLLCESPPSSCTVWCVWCMKFIESDSHDHETRHMIEQKNSNFHFTTFFRFFTFCDYVIWCVIWAQKKILFNRTFFLYLCSLADTCELKLNDLYGAHNITINWASSEFCSGMLNVHSVHYSHLCWRLCRVFFFKYFISIFFYTSKSFRREHERFFEHILIPHFLDDILETQRNSNWTRLDFLLTAGVGVVGE